MKMMNVMVEEWSGVFVVFQDHKLYDLENNSDPKSDFYQNINMT